MLVRSSSILRRGGLSLALTLAATSISVHGRAQPAQPAQEPAKPAKPKPKPKPRADKTENKGETPSDAAAPAVPATGAASGAAGTAAPTDAAPPPPPPPPPAPPPWDGSSTSISGTQLVPSSSAPAQPPTVAAAGSGFDAEKEADMDRRMRALEARLDAADKANAENDEKLSWLRKFKVSGYVQPQLLWQWYNAAASPNAVNGQLPAGVNANDVIAKQDPVTGVGITSNGDYFRLRRARLKTEFMPTEYARFVLEIEPFPTGGPVGGIGTMARQVEAQGIAHWTHDITTEFAMGIFKIPFGYEVLQSDADRPFIERSWGERNMTPGEYDTGARAYSSFLENKLKVQIAVVNGQIQGEKTFAILPDLNKGKDLVGRVNYNFGPIEVGASGYYGQGQIVDPVGIRFKQFPRWAGNLELFLHYTFPFMRRVGQTRVLAEGTLAQDMDRGVNYGLGIGLPAFPADVVNGAVVDKDERNTWVRIEQDLTEWFTLALRYDYYTPDSAQATDGRDTFGAVAVVHFTRGLQWMLEVDHAVDNVHVPGSAPPGKQIDTLSNVLQVRF